MSSARFDANLEAALAALYEAYHSETWSQQTVWNLRLLNAVTTSQTKFHAQLLQDAFVLATTRFMRGGLFVEIGVGDGVHLSNTLTLERDFGWQGLLIEANPFFWPEIERNRPTAQLAKLAVLGKARGPLVFHHVPSFPEISALEDFAAGDHHNRSDFDAVSVDSAGIVDVLEAHAIPRTVDYVSIDVEGPEIEILSAMLDAGYRPRIFTIEHNRVADRIQSLHDLLSTDYEIVAAGASNWDLWAVEKTLAQQLQGMRP